MGNMKEKRLLITIVNSSVVLVTLCIAPYTSLDPFSSPKLSVLSFLSLLALPITLMQILKLPKYRNLIVIVFLFCLQMLFSLVFSGTNYASQFYGSWSRNTGILAYISLVTLMLVCTLVSDRKFLSRFLCVTFWVGIVINLYGLIQFFGVDPFPFQNVGERMIFGTFGNSNFMSAFLGIISIMSLVQASLSKSNRVFRAVHLCLSMISLLVIKLTNSIQGFYSFFIALMFIAIVYLYVSKHYRLFKLFLTFSAFCGIILILGLLNIGPLSSIMAQSSLTARQYYWKAAIRILVDKPFFGVGFDNFGDWARRFRSSQEATKYPQFISDVPHSVPLDFAVGGGIPLIVLYFGIIVMTLISVYRVVVRLERVDVKYLALIGGWIAYQVQSFISINQLGLAIWGWVFSGIIIGYDLNSQNQIEINQGLKDKIKDSTKIQGLKIYHQVSIGLVLALIVSTPSYLASVKFYRTLETGNPILIQQSAYIYPFERMRFFYVANALNQNGYFQEAIMVLRDASRLYPDSFDIWRLWSTIPSASTIDVTRAKAEMKRLDPYNLDLK